MLTPTTTKTLQLNFLDGEAKNSSLTLTNVKEDLTAETVATAMNEIITANVFERKGVDAYNEARNARYIERTVTPLYENSTN